MKTWKQIYNSSFGVYVLTPLLTGFLVSLFVWFFVHIAKTNDQPAKEREIVKYESMVAVGDYFPVRPNHFLPVKDNPLFVKGTKERYRAFFKKDLPLILKQGCLLESGGYFEVLEVIEKPIDYAQSDKIIFVFRHNKYPRPVDGFCPDGLKGELFLDQFINLIKTK